MAKKKKNDVTAVEQDKTSQTEEGTETTASEPEAAAQDDSATQADEADDGPDNSDKAEAAEALADEEDETIEPENEAEDEANGTDSDVQDIEVTAEEILALRKELEATRQESERNLENWQRTAAELANFKRRQEEQMKLQRDRIKSEVLEGVISALDDMDLAFQNLPDELDGQLVGWVEGFRLVQRKLDKILDDQNVMLINTEGQFDPNFHEAISYEEHDERETDEIIAELRKGYQIGNRVIRPALVRVAR